MKLFVIGITLSLLLSVTLVAVGGEASDGNENVEESELASFAGGSGTPEDPYLIENVTQLQAMNQNLSAHYAMANDIDASETKKWNGGKGFEPIGEYDYDEDLEFTGSLDGRNHTVSELYIDRSNVGRVGLFGVTDGAVVKNIGLIDVNISGYGDIGSLVGLNYGTVSNSYATGNVNGINNVGGLIGKNGGTVRFGIVLNSFATGNVSGESSVGGLVGYNFDTVNNSYATGNVSGNSSIGGLVGENDEGTVLNSHYNIDSVLINDGHHITIGGLFDEQYQDWIEDMELDIQDYSDTLIPSVDHYEINSVEGLRDLLGFADKKGYDFRLSSDIDMSNDPGLYIPYLAADFDGQNHHISNLNIDLPFASHIGMFGYVKGGNVTNVNMVDVNISGDKYVGGLVGFNYYGLFFNSSASGNVSGNNYVGGLVGRNNYGTVSNSYATGDVSGDWWAGGLIGWNDGNVSNSYAIGDVNGGDQVGGLVGWNDVTVENSYATGDVSGDKLVGGLVGGNDVTVENSYATGDVSGDKLVGGLVGGNSGTVSNSYATGNVSGNSSVGGLVGDNQYGTVSNSFWNIYTTGQDDQDIFDGGTGKTTEEMKNITTYSDWNITEVSSKNERDTNYTWNIVDGETYPFLSWEEPEKGSEEEPEEDGGVGGIPIFKTILLLLAIFIAVAIYRKKKG